MFRRFHHGHSLALGVLAGFGMAGYRPYLILALGAILGASTALGAVGAYKMWGRISSAFEVVTAAATSRKRKSDFRQSYDPSKADIPF